MAVSQISSDNVGGGAAAFDAIKEAHPEGGKVLVVSIDPGISPSDARAEGFEQAVAEDDNFAFLGIQYSHNEPATAEIGRAHDCTPVTNAHRVSRLWPEKQTHNMRV